jgi:uncharacterized membrane protein HdeD (DUF308 family)
MEETLNSLTMQKHSTAWSITVGILLIVIGLAAIAVPFLAGVAASLLFGWLLVIAGIAHLVYAWSERRAGAVLWQILIGAVYLIAALYMLVFPIAGVATLTLVVAFYIVAEGAFEVAVFVRLRRLHGAAWFILIYWPFSSLWAVGTLMGISLLLGGIARITLPMSSPGIMPLRERGSLI